MNTRIYDIGASNELDAYNTIFHIRLAWEDEEKGFGLIDIEQDNYGISINSECMSADFIKKVLCSLVDQAKIE
jgi:hypothetical protein